MIIPNGFIEIEITTGGGLDNNGHAIACVTTYSSKRFCQYTKRADLQQRVEGEAATVPSYEIFIDSNGTDFTAERIRLSNKSSQVIGIYAVRSIEELEAVGQYKLTV